jgi:hypothetical protein
MTTKSIRFGCLVDEPVSNWPCDVEHSLFLWHGHVALVSSIRSFDLSVKYLSPRAMGLWKWSSPLNLRHPSVLGSCQGEAPQRLVLP